MKMTILLQSISILLLLTTNVMALPVATIERIKGKVIFEDKALVSGDLVTKNGLLSTGPKSFVKLVIKEWGNTITLGPNSKMQLDLTKKTTKKKYQFLSGSCRWRTTGKMKKGKIFTRRVAIGVRGTDYLLKHNDLLNESEIIVFDGEVEMQNVSNQKVLRVKKGQWGGLGGRFGESLKGPIDLPKKFIGNYEKALLFQ